MKITIEGEPEKLADFIQKLRNEVTPEESDSINDMTEADMDKFII